jgi:hypothetical protein
MRKNSKIFRGVATVFFSTTVAVAAFGAPPNPPPENKLGGYSSYELAPVQLQPGIEGKKNAGKVLAKVDENMRASVESILSGWNAKADAAAPNKLVIESTITTLHKPSGAGRFFAGAFMGDGKIVINAKNRSATIWQGDSNARVLSAR